MEVEYKRVNATPTVYGGVYSNLDEDGERRFYVLTKGDGGFSSWMSMSGHLFRLENDYEVDDYTYHPNAKLVIEE